MPTKKKSSSLPSPALFVMIVFLAASFRLPAETSAALNRNGDKLESLIRAFLVFRKKEEAKPLKDARGQAAEAGRLRQWLKRLEAIPATGLSADQDLDRLLLRSELRSGIAEIERERRWEKDPGLYLSFSRIESLVSSPPSGQAADDSSLRESLQEIPRQIATAQANLKNPPLLFLDHAGDTLDAMLAFFKKELREFVDAFPPRRQTLAKTYEKALAALESFKRFLELDLRLRARGTMGIGRDLYNYYLREKYFLEDDVDSLLKKGEAYFAETLQLLEETARRIDPAKTWQELIAANRKDHPDIDTLFPAWEKEIQRARRHVIEKNLVRIPDGESVRVIPMPASGRKQSPFGVMDTPSPYAESKVGSLIINPVDPGLSDAEKDELLGGHEYTFISTIAPHETYPGHHVHALKIQQNPRPLRKALQSTLFVEGWGLYAEELMYETGFFEDSGRTRLTQLRSRLWRAARVILDVQLQTNRISYDQARKFLEERVLFEPSRSAGEVNMYIQSPTYFITYIVGYYDIMKLREDLKRKLGKDFNLHDFHEAMLGSGSLPTPLLRELLLAKSDK